MAKIIKKYELLAILSIFLSKYCNFFYLESFFGHASQYTLFYKYNIFIIDRTFNLFCCLFVLLNNVIKYCL